MIGSYSCLFADLKEGISCIDRIIVPVLCLALFGLNCSIAFQIVYLFYEFSKRKSARLSHDTQSNVYGALL